MMPKLDAINGYTPVLASACSYADDEPGGDFQLAVKQTGDKFRFGRAFAVDDKWVQIITHDSCVIDLRVDQIAWVSCQE